METSLDIKLNSHVNFLKTQIQIKPPKLPADALSVPPRKQTESFWFRTKYADFSNLLHEHEMRTMKEHLNQIRCSLWVESFVLSTSALWGAALLRIIARDYIPDFTQKWVGNHSEIDLLLCFPGK